MTYFLELEKKTLPKHSCDFARDKGQGVRNRRSTELECKDIGIIE